MWSKKKCQKSIFTRITAHKLPFNSKILKKKCQKMVVFLTFFTSLDRGNQCKNKKKCKKCQFQKNKFQKCKKRGRF